MHAWASEMYVPMGQVLEVKSHEVAPSILNWEPAQTEHRKEYAGYVTVPPTVLSMLRALPWVG